MARVRIRVVDLLRATAELREETRAREERLQRECFPPREGAALEAAARISAFVDEMYDLETHSRFNRVSWAERDGRCVALSHAYIESRTVKSRLIEVVHCNIVVTEDARRENLTNPLVLRHILAYFLLHGLSRTPRYYVGHCITPITYHFVCERSLEVAPSSEVSSRDLILAYEALTGGTIDDVALIREPVYSPLSASAERWIARAESRHVSYFIEQNPEFRKGIVMPFVVRVDLRAFVYTLRKMMWQELKRAIGLNPRRG